MFSENLNNAINEQINNEFYSGYFYLYISSCLKELGLFDASEIIKTEAKNSVENGLKIFDYMTEKSEFVTLKKIPKFEIKFKNVATLFLLIAKHKNNLKKSVQKVIKLAQIEQDTETIKFISNIN